MLRFWRDEPGFAQRATVSVEADGSVLQFRTQLNEDGSYRRDLEMTYRRR